jgi:regulator of RNase E activity RraA
MSDALSPELLANAAVVTTASLSSQLAKRGMRTRAITNVASVNPATPRLFGPAYTLRYIPMREDLAVGAVMADPNNPQRATIERAPAGSIIVVDTNGMQASGTFGDILVARLKFRGVAGVVSDGPMRDIAEVRQIAFPVFARGNAAPPSYASMLAVDAQVPIGCGGVAVFPGDFIVGDADGVIVIPKHLAEEVVRDALEQDRMEQFIRRKVDAGSTIIGVYPPNEATLAEYRASKR